MLFNRAGCHLGREQASEVWTGFGRSKGSAWMHWPQSFVNLRLAADYDNCQLQPVL